LNKLREAQKEREREKDLRERQREREREELQRRIHVGEIDVHICMYAQMLLHKFWG
jgi:hypothetical protein